MVVESVEESSICTHTHIHLLNKRLTGRIFKNEIKYSFNSTLINRGRNVKFLGNNFGCVLSKLSNRNKITVH